MTASLQLWHGCRCPSVSQWAKHRSDLRAFDRRPSDGRSLPVAYSAMGTVAYQPLTPCVALLSRGAPDSPTSPPRQKDDDFIEPERLPLTACPFRLLSHGGEGRRAPASAISAIHEHDRDLPSPVSARRRLPSQHVSTGNRAPLRARPAELPWNQGFDRAFAGRTPPGRDCSRRGWLPRPA